MKNLTAARKHQIELEIRRLDLVHDAEQLMELEAELFQIENAPLSGDWR